MTNTRDTDKIVVSTIRDSSMSNPKADCTHKSKALSLCGQQNEQKMQKQKHNLS